MTETIKALLKEAISKLREAQMEIEDDHKLYREIDGIMSKTESLIGEE